MKVVEGSTTIRFLVLTMLHYQVQTLKCRLTEMDNNKERNVQRFLYFVAYLTTTASLNISVNLY
jgi:hypothetical protein